jgi:glucosyl-dolichyl phosphate glucuronosyltransferase
MREGALDVSVVVPTYNRAGLLAATLRSLFAQRPGDVAFEIIVVDNRSTDGTAETVDALRSHSPVPLQYAHEPRQGNAYARNTGVERARAPIVAFLDDDVVADESWVRVIASSLGRDPELSFVGGSILPSWEADPPSWLTPTHWAPLALLDYGPEAFDIHGPSPRAVLTANFAVRRAVFDALGGFSPRLQRVASGIGSMEDHEFLLRLCRAGKRGRYVPQMVVHGHIAPERLTKEYHRRWHTGHGHFYGLLEDPEWERSRFTLFGVPSHLYREMLPRAARWCVNVVAGRANAAFVDECRLRFFRGFVLQRRRRPVRAAAAPSTPR